MSNNTPLITSGQEWTFPLIEEITRHIERIATEKYKLNCYPNQIEIISYEQMLDAYSAVGLPLMYDHWSYGQQFVQQLEMYKRGYMGLAYEIVINSNPCISYCMEENTMLMQTLVIAHAAFGHNHFFKNNYLFKQWTDADSIIDYLAFAKKYIRECEERYGYDRVEAVLDAAHALQRHGVDKYKRPPKLSTEQAKQLQREQERHKQLQMNDLWRTIPTKEPEETEKMERFPKDPQENLLYFIEKNAPKLETWEREIIRIVRKISQYFYPQMQTKIMNEGMATYTHYKIMHDLYDEGLIDDGAMLEFYHSHTAVVVQPEYNDRRYSGINPYALGFAMMQDIERVATNPTDEDRDWFGDQTWVGSGNYVDVIHHAVANFKDESFIMQYLSPKVIRDFRLFAVLDDHRDNMLEISAIHNKNGYKHVRNALARQQDISKIIPQIEVFDVDIWESRDMVLRHHMVDGKHLDVDQTLDTLEHLSFLWGYDVTLKSVDVNKKTQAVYEIIDGEVSMDVFVDDDE